MSAFSLRVLLVEDSAVVRHRLLDLMSDVEAIDTIGVAIDAPQGMALFASERPDVVVLDVRLPGGSGLDVLKHIRRLDTTCLVIMLTSYALPEIRERCLAAGANFFLDKATEFERVVHLIAGQLPS